MISYRENSAKIGADGRSYQSFFSKPNSLRQAIRSMDAPVNWHQVQEIFKDKYWTDEVQGVAWDGSNWLFSCNAQQIKPGSNAKSIYTVKWGKSLDGDIWFSRLFYSDVPHPISSTESDDHWGQLTYYNGMVYVSHFFENDLWEGRKSVVVFKDEGGILQFEKWIPLGQVTFQDGQAAFYPEFQGINPWDGLLYSCRGDLNPEVFFTHYANDQIVNGEEVKAGNWTRSSLKFSGGENKAYAIILGGFPLVQKVPADLPSNVQGACFSPNGHVYIACDIRLEGNDKNKAIACFSALNGHLMGIIPVLAEETNQELEGICYGEAGMIDGSKAYIHAILLENRDFALDNIFFKSFSADQPDMV